MSGSGLVQLLVFLALLLAVTKPLGAYMANVFGGKRTLLSKPLLPLERMVYRVCGVRPEMDQRWTA